MKTSKRPSTRALAKRLGISQTMVQRRRQQGWSDSAIEAAARRRTQTARKMGEFAEPYFDALRRKAIAQADLKEWAARERASQLIEAAVAERTWIEIAAAIRGSILDIPTRVSAKLAAMTDAGAITAMLRAEIREALTRVSEDIAGSGGESGRGRSGVCE